MARQIRLTPLIGLGLALSAPLIALADSSDSARLGDIQYGNALDPRGWTPVLGAPDPNGMSRLHAGSLRTPSGTLYPAPSLFGEHILGDWHYSGLLEVGYTWLSGHDDALFVHQYNDWNKGLALGLLWLDAYKPETGDYLEFRGSRAGDDDQFYRARGGRYGSYKVEAFYRDIPHLISSNAYPIWDGVGSGNLTLPAGLSAGDSEPAAVAAASDAAPRRKIKVDRSRTGVSLEGNIARQWIAYASLTNEERNGTRLWGGPMFFNYPFANNGGIMETVRPIDFTTTDVSAGARFVGALWRFNAVYTGSFFRDHQDQLDFQSPFHLTPVTGSPPVSLVSRGQFSLEPDNDAHNLRLELSRSLPWSGELSLTGAVGTMRQDDNLLAPTTCQGRVGIDLSPGPNFTVDCADWNTSAALSQKSADARIDTLLLDARLSFRPLPELGWHLEIRHYDEDNKTDYLSYNPQTGEYGYISENGSQAAVVPGEIGIFDPRNPLYASYFGQIRAVPYGYSDTSAELGADWRIGARNTLSAAYTYDRNQPDYRERSQVDENRLALAWVSRSIADGTLRVSYDFAVRSGDGYDYFPYADFYSVSVPGFVPSPAALPFTVDAMRKYDLSNRKQNKFRAIFTHPVGDNATASTVLYGRYNDYSARVGRHGDNATGLMLQWDYQPLPSFTFGAYVGGEFGETRMSNVADAEAVVSADPHYGGAKYPYGNSWNETDKERNLNAGLNFARSFGRTRVDGAYSFVYARGQLDYDYATTAALAANQLPFASELSAFPDTHYRVHTVDLGITQAVTNELAMRLFGRYEFGDFDDWHYAGFDRSLSYDHRIYTDRGPGSHYDASLIGLMLQLKI